MATPKKVKSPKVSKPKAVKKLVAKEVVEPVAVEPVQAPTYTIVVSLGGRRISGTGNTVLEAIQAVPKPVKITTKAVLTISDGQKKSRELLYNIPRMKRFFYPMAQYSWAKQLDQLLK